jgi:hypothetical protein
MTSRCKKKNIKMSHFASALIQPDSMKVPFQLAQYNLVELPDTDQYNVYYVPLDNSKKIIIAITMK